MYSLSHYLLSVFPSCQLSRQLLQNLRSVNKFLSNLEEEVFKESHCMTHTQHSQGLGVALLTRWALEPVFFSYYLFFFFFLFRVFKSNKSNLQF